MAEVLTEDPGAEGLSVAKRKGWSEERELIDAPPFTTLRFVMLHLRDFFKCGGSATAVFLR